jgi:IclR family KDG regulon transcriptional repressor
VDELATQDPRGLRSVTIAMGVLECFTGTDECGASDIARQVGIAKSTASRMLATLAAGGLLERRPNGRYRLGIRLFEYGQLAADRLLLKELALPVLGELRDRVSETVQLGIPLGSQVLYVDRLEGTTHGLRFHTEAFRRVPGHSSSCGRAIAAFNPVVEQAVLNAGFRRHTPHTVMDPERYRAALAIVRERGWASAEEEFEIGLSSIAVPVLVRSGDAARAVGAVSIAGPTQRVLGARGNHMVAPLLRAGERISRALVDVADGVATG